MAEWVGFLAAILTTACYIPQALHVVRERNTAGISLFAYTILFAGVLLWLVYGVMIGSLPVMLANGLTLPLLSIVIAIKIRHK